MWRSAWRFLRLRLVLGCIFLFSLSYFLVKTGLMPFMGPGPDMEDQVLEEQKFSAYRHIQWLSDEAPGDSEINPNNKSSSVIVDFCRNTRQGKTEVTDDKGYTCSHGNLQSNGCCDTSSGRRFMCDACHVANGCCHTYEGCVSCCLRPEQKTSLLDVIQATSGHRLRHFLSVKDQFELCLLKCRTSSSSVHSENKYKSYDFKYCYKQEPSGPFHK
uniref:SREBP regulating gene protein n=1 Tax=Plectus sambesii TaxID=2011161 RepID=A0A914VVR4_9BILA